MHGLIIKPGDGVIPFNRETVTDPTRERCIEFECFGTRYRCTMQIPVYMDEALDSEAWDRAEKMVKERIGELRLQAAAEGKLLQHQWGDDVERFAKTCVYNEFMKVQVQRGNGEGHAVPADFL
jgi:hypothetical protein